MGSALPIASPRAGRLAGTARVGARTKDLVRRLRPGDIAVIDHADLDAVAARSLAEAGVAAVVNASPFISGRYPNRGPDVLSQAQVPMYQLERQEDFAAVRDGTAIALSDLELSDSRGQLCGIEPWSAARIHQATERARANLGEELEKFARNTLQYLDADKDLLLDPTDVPDLRPLKISGRHAMVVVRGEDYKEDLRLLRSYVEGVHPVLIAVDGAAEALLERGHKPDVIIGDMDSISDDALSCGARLIVHAYARRNGEAPGLARLRRLGLRADTFAVPGTSEDAALLLAYENGAELIIAVGTHSNLEDFLDKGRAGMASTFLVRLKVGRRLIDARGVCKLYQPQIPFTAFAAVFLSAMFPFIILLSKSLLWHNTISTLHIWLQLHLPFTIHHR